MNFKKLLITAFASVSFAAASSTAYASFLATVTQIGSDVVITGSGTINLLALGVEGKGGTAIAGIDPTIALLGIGPTGAKLDLYHALIAGPANFGPGMLVNGSGTGDFVALETSLDEILVPADYLSHAPLSDTNTFVDQTFASLGLTAGTYAYTLGVGAVTDSFTIQIGPAASMSNVPEPEQIALFGVGFVGLAVTRRHRSESLRVTR